MVVKILLRCDTQRPNHRLSLLKLLKDLDLQPTNIIPRNNSFLVIFKHNFNQDVLFSQHTIAKLRELDCSLVEPPSLRARRTILVFRVDPYVYDEDPEDIRRDIESSNAHSEIEEIVKFPNSRTLKIIFTSEKAARLAAERGLIAFYLLIPPEDIENEIYIDIKMCLKCYKINEHSTTECDRPGDYIVCSLCSSHEHKHRQCSSSQRKCINCGGSHSTMSSTCEMRKEAIRHERKKAKSSKTLPTNVLQSSTVFQSQPSDFPALVEKHRIGSADDSLKCYMALVISSWKNKENPGSFNIVLNNLLSKNNLPALDASDIKTITPDTPVQFSSNDVVATLTTDDLAPANTTRSPANTSATSGPNGNTITTPNSSVTPVPSPNITPFSPSTTSVATTGSPANTTVTSPAAQSSACYDNTDSTESVSLPVATNIPPVLATANTSLQSSTAQPAAKRELRSTTKPPVITVYTTKTRDITLNNLDQLLEDKKILISSSHPRDFALSALKCDPSSASVKVVSYKEFKRLQQ